MKELTNPINLLKLNMKKRTEGNEFYKKLLTIAPSTYDASRYDFRQHLEKCFDKYLRWLDEYGFGYIKYNNIETINLIKETVQLYYEGRHSKAFECIKHLFATTLLDHKNFPFKDYYRMRIFDDGEKHDRNGMFHIPFNKRTIVKTQRFSAPGYPCLYLGTSAYICWEEMLRPNLDKCYVSRFHSGNSIFVFDLSLPAKSRFKNDQYFSFDLLRFPLVLACMVKVAKPKDPFKPEYILPQLLMEWVIEQRDSNLNLMGIAYHSVHKSNDFKFSLAKSVNLAIPAFLPRKGDYSMRLCEMFKVTDPTCDELERAKRPYEIIERDRDMTDLEYSYRISTFGQLEDRLKDETKFPLKKVRNVTKTDIYSKEVLFE